MRRKRIAVFIASIDKQYQQVFSAGLAKASRNYDVDICIFNCLGFSDTQNADHEEEEAVIYELPDMEQFDGMISLYATQANPLAEERLMQILHTYPNLPHVSLDVCLDNAVTVTFDDIDSVKELTRYLITQKGRTKFAFVEGPSNNDVSRARRETCREVLAEFGLELPEDMIRSGDWTHDGGRQAALDILKTDRPEVFMCANDYMAFGVHEAIREKGIVYPEEVLVVGFDAIREAVAMGMPTINRPVDKAADLAVELLKRWIDGERPEKDLYLLQTEIFYGDIGPENNKTDTVFKRLQTLVDDYRSVLEVMAQMGVSGRGLAGVGEVDEAGKRIATFTAALGMEDVHVCVSPAAFGAESGKQRLTPYPERMYLMTGCVGGQKQDVGYFLTRNLLPFLQNEDREPVCMVFCSLRLGEQNFGYIAMKYNQFTGEPLYPSLMLICGALNSLSLQYNMRKSAELVEHMALHDSMTGMLNRRGYEKYASEVFREARENKQWFVMMSVDMDRLKYINDRYGHQAGDEAICRLGRALKCLEGRGCVCVHISGDEFLVYGICKNENDSLELVPLVEQALSEMNGRDPWLCSISASMGIFAAVPRGIDMLDGFLTQADRNMYEIKRKKQQRGMT